MNKNKIKYGLSNAVVWPILSVDTDGKPTYGESIRVPGSVNLTLDPEGTTEPFYADNVVYYLTAANNGYTGALEIALVPDEFKTEILGQRIDDNGVAVESTNDKTREFAMAFQFEGDQHATRYLFPRVASGRTAVTGSTKEENITPQTEELALTVMGRIDNNIAKLYVEQDNPAYVTWLEEPYEPTFTIDPEAGE